MISKQKLFWPISLGIALIFQALFFKFNAGLNYLIFTLLLLSVLRFYIKPQSYSNTFKLVLLLVVAVTFSVVFANTTYSIFIYWIFAIILISVAGYSRIKHIELTPLLLLNGFESLANSVKNNRQVKFTERSMPYIKFIFLPIFTIIILLWLYALSNTLFAESLTSIADYISDFFAKISFARFFFTLLGLLIAVIFLSNKPVNSIITLDEKINSHLIRVKSSFKKVGVLSKLLLRKKQVAIVTFIILNIMIAWLNYLDIENIWIGFKWDGGFLKSMIHEGTNMLIFAILISIGITLFYLSSNLVFLKNNRLFYGLLIVWLLQNILMAVSVSIRNTIYIEHFSLAYKRIFVYFFLLACIVGLLSIIFKIIYKRSISFLISVNSISVLVIVLISSAFNWDKIMAKYNFENYKKSFVHFNFLVDLNNSALPLLIKSDAELNKIYENQSKQFPFVREKEFDLIDYQTKIEKQKNEFLIYWKTKSILEWNYPEYVAYNELLKK